MRKFSIIVAFDGDRGIGKDGFLPWHLSADLKHFKEITTARSGAAPNVVIMGRKTWESIPDKFRPLPGRINLVLTSRKDYPLPKGVLKADSFEKAIDVVSSKEDAEIGDIFIIGGAQVFAQAICHPSCQKIYLTRIYERHECDVFFPEIPLKFVETEVSGKFQENKKTFSFSTFEVRS